MKIQCPNCRKITELEHVDAGSNAECVCGFTFEINRQTMVEEYTEIDRRLPERIGSYPVTGLIGFGGMGKVYLGTHPALGLPVAIKMLRMEYMTDQASCSRFMQAARICARINHPNIVRIYDCGYDQGNVYLVMEYIPGGSAQDLLEQEGKLDQDHAALILLEICSGLVEAEKLGIVHRDIKPENIMFDRDGEVKLLDLGLSKIIGDSRIGSQSVTADLTSLGTPQYMSPEQAADAGNCDSRADIYSIGVTLYQLCTGRLPFESDNPDELRRMHALTEPVPPRRLNPGLRPGMESVILRCLKKKRDERYANITELALDLEACLKNRILPSTMKQTSQQTAQPVEKPFRFHRKQLLRISAAGIGFILILLCGFILFLPKKQPVQSPELTVAEVLRKLARQTAGYAADCDFDKVIGIYSQYNGPYKKETSAERAELIRGFQLTQYHLRSELCVETAALILNGEWQQALQLYRGKHGRTLYPEADNLLYELSTLKPDFRNSWEKRCGETVQLRLTENQEKLPVRIIGTVKGTVYGRNQKTMKLIPLELTELPQDELLAQLAGRTPETKNICLGVSLLKHGKRDQALALLSQSSCFGTAFRQCLDAPQE